MKFGRSTSDTMSVARILPGVSPREILKMATENGAKAIGFNETLGTLSPGKKGVFQYLDIKSRTPDELLESIVHAEIDNPAKVNML